jgi:hypothetical protein
VFTVLYGSSFNVADAPKLSRVIDQFSIEKNTFLESELVKSYIKDFSNLITDFMQLKLILGSFKGANVPELKIKLLGNIYEKMNSLMTMASCKIYMGLLLIQILSLNNKH